MSDLQSQLEDFQNAISKTREAVGAIGGSGSSGSVREISSLQEEIFESLTTAAITQTVILELENETVELDRINRIEHQSWVRAVDTDGNFQVINLMNVNQISTYAA